MTANNTNQVATGSPCPVSVELTPQGIEWASRHMDSLTARIAVAPSEHLDAGWPLGHIEAAIHAANEAAAAEIAEQRIP